jgi:signal transduction histidine kinase
LPALWNTNICWFRLHLSIDSNVAKQQLLFLIQQTGASEIYLNGHLLEKFGNIAKDSTKTKGVSPVLGSFIPFPISSSGDELLAIRFALQRGIFYFNFYGLTNSAFALTVAETTSVSDMKNSDIVVYFEWARVGIFLILSVLHLALFLLNKLQKANFYFFIYAFLSCIDNFSVDLTNRHETMVANKMLQLTVGVFLAYLMFLFFVLAVYKVFHYRSKWVVWTLAALAVANIIFFGSSLRVTFWLMSGSFILSMLEVIRVSFIALKVKQRGATIVISGAILFMAFFLFFLLIMLKYLPSGPNFIYGHFVFNISFLSLPISISVYLALESSYASRMLEEKLGEVHKLSEQRREQEKEKQQLLASQNEILEKQVGERTSALQHSIEELRSTQAQLIQSEKMASLGQLTAGIAHEIQNPLNFINNFSDVNRELITELEQEMDKGNYSDAKGLAGDIQTNEEKINYHGKRADAIVKGMLLHSNTSSGKKESTDINKLSTEYMQLAFHGFKAKNKEFNVALRTSLDETIGKINIIPQDIGRVLLNLYNNAFYAVDEKRKTSNPGYEPMVMIKTIRLENKILVIVSDNGNGIPENIIAKIFQPFFTTKPTGQGTGLGLSMSYDIVNAHGGEIRVETKEGEGSEFVIQLPI